MCAQFAAHAFKIRISNEDWNEDLRDIESSAFQNLSARMEREVMLCTKYILNVEKYQVKKIVNFNRYFHLFYFHVIIAMLSSLNVDLLISLASCRKKLT